MIKVKSRGSETTEQLLRRFKKMCEKEGLIRELKKKQFYEKPSVVNRRRSRQSLKTQIYAARANKHGF